MSRIVILILFLFLSVSYADLLEPNGYIRKVHVLFEWEQEPDAIAYNLQILNSQNLAHY